LAQMCQGGSAQLARALVKDIREHGSEVLTGVETKRIRFHGRRVAGIDWLVAKPSPPGLLLPPDSTHSRLSCTCLSLTRSRRKSGKRLRAFNSTR
jgi:phytoene dehydrogenase-like protein